MSPNGKPALRVLRENLPNLASVLGVLPLCLVFAPGGQSLLPALLLYNNAMDDLDGLLARLLHAESAFGAALDNLCDAVAHIVLAMAVAGGRGSAALGGAALVCAAILLRMGRRLNGIAVAGHGSTTNELMRHLFLALVAERVLGQDLTPVVTALFVAHAFTLVAPFPMPYLVRTLARTPGQIALVNASLVAAWLWPPALAAAIAAYGGSYVACLAVAMPGRSRSNLP
jgi:phosphatidylglycerophosphate synthase